MLRLKKDIDLLRPYIEDEDQQGEGEMEGSDDKSSATAASKKKEKKSLFIENFHELSMREALRCDLRNGHHMKNMEQQQQQQQQAGIGLDARRNLSSHPGLRSVVFEAMNPPSDWDMDTTDARGNWGLWNFEGQGPEGGS